MCRTAEADPLYYLHDELNAHGQLPPRHLHPAWSAECTGLPYAITLAMFFSGEPPIETQMTDIGTLYTKHVNYLKNLTGFAVYRRDRYDSPISEVEALDSTEMEDLLQRATAAADKLYTRIASMSYRDKIIAGATVYYTDWIAPFARAAGMWDRLLRDHDVYSLDPLTLSAYEPLVERGEAATLVPPLFITGSGFRPLTAPDPAR